MGKDHFVEERRNKIMELLKKHNRIKVSEMALMFGVTDDLIRKDLKILENEGVLKRTYGGAILNTKMSEVEPFNKGIQKVDQNSNVVRKASSYVEDGDTIFIESSTLNQSFVRLLANKKDLTIITNGFHGISTILPFATVISTGGIVHKKDEAYYGNITNENIKQFYYDKCFLSLAGVTRDWVFTAAIEENVPLKRIAMRNSKETILLIPWDKWNHHGIFKVGSIQDVDLIISDTDDDEVIKFLTENGIKFL